jgi:molybdopterin molybdotransferase
MNKTVTMIPIEEAWRILDETIMDIRLETELLPVSMAPGRIVEADQISRLDLPPFDKSAMDGYAILADDDCDEFKLLEVVPAGIIGKEVLVPGTTIKVMTGAAVPGGTDRVVMVENAVENNGKIRFLKTGGSKNICRYGEDVQAGQIVLKAGSKIGPAEIANLVSCGITEVSVYRKLKLAILSTGDEIVNSMYELEPGKIMNSNGPMLEALAVGNGFEVVSSEIVPDSREATITALRNAAGSADIVALSGGVSAGDYDYVIDALNALDFTIHFSRVAVKPGKPVTYASGNGAYVFGLPGNPVSVYLTFHLYLMRAAARLTGSAGFEREIELPLKAEFKRKNAQRRGFYPCIINKNGFLEMAEYHGSAHLGALINTDGFFTVPEGVSLIGTGEKVSFYPLNWSVQ